MSSISSMSSFSTTSVSRRPTTFDTGCSASTSRITLCFTPSGTPGLVSALRQIRMAGERGAERLQLDEGRIDVARLRDDVEQGARVPAR